MNKHLARTLAACACTLAIGLAATGCSGTPAPAPEGGITVSSSARVSVVPDKCDFSVTVAVQGDSASEAQRAAAKPVKSVMDKLKELGVDEKSIQTTYTDVSPVWDENGVTDQYESRTVMEVSGVPVEQAGELMQAATDAGATEVGSLEYSSTSYEESYAEALAQAVKDSRPKAEAIAEAGGVRLGDVVSVSEGYQDMSYLAKANGAYAAAEEADMGIDIAPGEVDIEAQVTVTYAIN